MIDSWSMFYTFFLKKLFYKKLSLDNMKVVENSDALQTYIYKKLFDKIMFCLRKRSFGFGPFLTKIDIEP